MMNLIGKNENMPTQEEQSLWIKLEVSLADRDLYWVVFYARLLVASYNKQPLTGQREIEW